MVQNRMQVQYRALIFAVVIAGLLAGGCGATKYGGAGHLKHATHHARVLSGATSTIVINRHIGEKFAPAPATVRPALTAQTAWARYARLNRFKSVKVPSNVTVRLGLFTLPVGPVGTNGSMVYRAKGELAYGYSWKSCPLYMNPSVTKPPKSPCIVWNFLNADTGRQIIMSWEQ